MTTEEYLRRLGLLLAVTETLIKERDEARRWVCQIGAKSKEEAETMAIRRGWYCYKEGKTDGK